MGALGAGVLERDQLLHGVLAVAHHVGRHALQRRHEPPADREQAVVGARDLLLDDHAVIGALRRLDGKLEAHPDVALRRDAGGHALALVPGDRLGDDRESEPRGSVPGLVQLEDDLATRHRQAEVVEEGLGAVLVRGELGVLDAVAAQYRGAATELLAAVAPLDHVLALEVEGGQPGAVARLEDGVDGGAAEAAAHEAAQHLGVARLEVERAAVVLVAQPVGDELDAAPANVRVDVLHGDGGNAVARRGDRPARREQPHAEPLHHDHGAREELRERARPLLAPRARGSGARPPTRGGLRAGRRDTPARRSQPP